MYRPQGRWYYPEIGRDNCGEARDVTYIIALPCVDVKDKACIEECPVDCIYEGERSLYIHPDECVDCGACEPVCPVEAIFYEDDTPEQWKDFYKANVELRGAAGRAEVLEELDVGLVEVLPLLRGVVLVEDRLDRADRLARATVHALVRVDVQRALAFVDA